MQLFQTNWSKYLKFIFNSYRRLIQLHHSSEIDGCANQDNVAGRCIYSFFKLCYLSFAVADCGKNRTQMWITGISLPYRTNSVRLRVNYFQGAEVSGSDCCSAV